MTGKIEVVVGGQFGSEAKGHVVAQLAYERPGLAVVRVAGPNAGHSAVGVIEGKRWALRQVPCAAVVNLDCALVIAAGSEIDPGVLQEEIEALDEAGYMVSGRLYVDRTATEITTVDKARESGLNERIGSTAKGIGAARASRIMRESPVWGGPYDTVAHLQMHLRSGGDVIIEGTQGYGLGLHTQFYPHCTSSDCRAIDFLAMAGLSPWAPYVQELVVWVVARSYPIRVAGNSGPLEGETTWEALAAESAGYIQPERTTVTQRIRRVAEWDPSLVRRAVLANGGGAEEEPTVRLAFMFLDYLFPELAGAHERGDLAPHHWATIRKVEQQTGAQVWMVGTGPDTVIRTHDHEGATV